jgi:hypothetical protein
VVGVKRYDMLQNYDDDFVFAFFVERALNQSNQTLDFR